MPGRKNLLAALALLLGLLGLAGAARAQSPLTVEPAHPTTRDSLVLDVSGNATSFCPPRFTMPEVHGTAIGIDGTQPPFPAAPDCAGPWTQPFSVPPLPAGTYQVEVRVDGALYAAQTVTVIPTPVGAVQL